MGVGFPWTDEIAVSRESVLWTAERVGNGVRKGKGTKKEAKILEAKRVESKTKKELKIKRDDESGMYESKREETL